MEQTIKPRIIPRSEHPISRSLVSSNALKVLYRLREKGHIAWLVGGCVRDLLLGREPKDFDVVTDATPGQLKRLFRNCRLVGRRFRLAHLHFKDEVIEVSTFRALAGEDQVEDEPLKADGTTGTLCQGNRLVSDDGLVIRDNEFGTPAEDSLRRDYTVNALAYNIADFTVIDHVGGLEDLQHGIIRTIGNPLSRFTEDPVRMLRAVRFAAQLGFSIEDSSWNALTTLAPSITRATAPRLYEEFLKLFLSGEGERTYQLMRQSGLFSALFPAVSDWLGHESEGFPHTRISRNLEWIDQWINEGQNVSPQLMIALMFGEYLEERVATFKEEGFLPQEAVNAAVAEFLGEQNHVVAIPHRIGLGVREIMLVQDRLKKIPGKRPQSVLCRNGFKDALAYLRCRCQVLGEYQRVIGWWERFAIEHVLPPIIPAGEEDSGRVKPRRRRRRRKGAKRAAVP